MTTDPILDRRRFHRITFHAPVMIEQGGQSWQTEMLDISLKGILTRRPSDWHDTKTSTLFTLCLPLDDENEVRIEARLMHQEAEHLGFECQKIDLDSATLLRRLVELNLGDQDLLDRDFAALLTPKN
jgi:hypothetical protein